MLSQICGVEVKVSSAVQWYFGQWINSQTQPFPYQVQLEHIVGYQLQRILLLMSDIEEDRKMCESFCCPGDIGRIMIPKLFFYI